MKLSLNVLKISNFMGIKDETFEFNGQNAVIKGANGSGKTSTANALYWLLFGKDIHNRQLSPVPLDKNNKEIYELIPMVEAEFQCDDKIITLKKESYPNLKKNHDTNREIYSGSRTTKQSIDKEPFKITEFQSYINNLIDESIFKLITNPFTFNQLDWQERRKILFAISGDISDEEIIQSKTSLEPLKELLTNHSIEQQKKIQAQSLKETKEQLKHIPIQIEALLKELPNEDDNKDYGHEIKEVESEIDSLKEKNIQLQNGGHAVEIKNEISKLKNDIDIARKNYESSNQNNGNQLKLETLRADLDIYKSRRERAATDYKEMKKKQDDYKKKWYELNDSLKEIKSREFDNDVDDHCPTCKQPLTSEKVEEAKDEALKHFNFHKSQKIEDQEEELNHIVKKGKEAKEEVERIEQQGLEYKEKIEKIQAKIDKLESQSSNDEVIPFEETDEYKELNQSIEKLNEKLKDITVTLDEELSALNQEIDDKKSTLYELQEKQANQQHLKRTKERVEEYKQTEKELLKVKESIEHKLDLIEQFTVTKVEKITNKVNEMFEMANFKLFNYLKNGEIKETCEVMFEGIEFNKGLNSANQINVGLDIIRTLSRYYDVQAPIFIDNAESVTDIINIDSQQIQLVVMKSKKKLEMETIIY